MGRKSFSSMSPVTSNAWSPVGVRASPVPLSLGRPFCPCKRGGEEKTALQTLKVLEIKTVKTYAASVL